MILQATKNPHFTIDRVEIAEDNDHHRLIVVHYTPTFRVFLDREIKVHTYSRRPAQIELTLSSYDGPLDDDCVILNVEVPDALRQRLGSQRCFCFAKDTSLTAENRILILISKMPQRPNNTPLTPVEHPDGIVEYTKGIFNYP